MTIFGLPWWVAGFDLIAAIIVLVMLVTNSRLGALILLVIASLATYFTVQFNPFQWIVEHPDVIVRDLLVYAVLGIIWGFVRWIFYINSQDLKNLVLSRHSSWASYAAKDPSYKTAFKDSKFYPFGFKDDAPMIATWVVFWPFSMIWYFGSKILIEGWDYVWNWILWVGRSFSGIYASLASKKVDQILKDEKKP